MLVIRFGKFEFSRPFLIGFYNQKGAKIQIF